MLQFPIDLMKELNQIESAILENSMSSVFPKLPSVFSSPEPKAHKVSL